MKNTFKIAVFSAIVTLAMACNKEDIQNPVKTDSETIEVSIDGLIDSYTPQDETKSEIQTVARVLWSNGDKVHVFDGTRHIGILTADITGTDGLYAKLSGTIQAPSGSVITFVHSPLLPTDSAPELSGGKICLDLSQQDGSTVPFIVYGTLPSPNSTAISDEVVKFALATSIYKVNCTGLPEEGDIIRAHVSDVNTVCALTLSANSEPTVRGEKMGRITRSGDGAFQAKDERAYISFAVVKSESGDRQVSIRKTTGLYYSSFDNKSFDAAKSYNTIVILKPVYPKGTTQGTFTFGDKKYCFAKGNLWYGKKDGASEATYNFEDSQLDYSTTWNPDHISHFYWSKSAEASRAETKPDQPARGDLLFTEYADFTADGRAGIWHAPSLDDWYEFLWYPKFSHGLARVTDSNGNVHNGVMLLPDDFTNPLDKSFRTSGINEYSLEEFAKMEYEGVVFLPDAGWRRDKDISEINESGIYYPSTMNGLDKYFFACVDNELDLRPNSDFVTMSAASLRLMMEF